MANITLFAQVISQLPKENIRKIIKSSETDKHCKGYNNTWSRFVSMIFSQFSGCNSVRDISNGLKSATGNLNHLGINRAPSKSTVAYQNANRDSSVFRDIFYSLFQKKYLLMLCCAAVCAGFAGCSDDEDEDDGVSAKSLVGRWSCYQEWDSEDPLYMDDEFGEGIDLFILEFNADGTCGQFDGLYLSELDDEKYWVGFTYTLNGSQLIMRESEVWGDYEPREVKCHVEKITSSELVLDYGLEKLYFHRMK